MFQIATMHGISRRSVIAAGGLLAAPAIVRAQGQNGVALVIGNSKYLWEATLPNVKRDAPDVAKRFQALGLKTELLQDLDRDAMRTALAKFKEASRGARLAAFYFAGHGVTWEKQIYVVPVDVDLSDPKTVQGLIPIPSVNAVMKEAANRLLVFDSCRNNPADGWKQREARNLARSDADDKVSAELRGPNTLVLFSTASGAVALDGPAGSNSPFAAALLRQLDASSVDLQALPGKLRRDLLLATECQQFVWDLSTYTTPFLLGGTGKAVSQPDPTRVLELSKAYAFAGQNGLFLPPGLLAMKPSNSSPDARMIGSYTCNIPVRVNANIVVNAPSVFIVMSVTDGTTAHLVGAAKDWSPTTGGTGSRWRYYTAAKTEKGVKFLTLDEFNNWEWAWRDQNSGTLVVTPTALKPQHLYGGTLNYPFTRLDG